MCVCISCPCASSWGVHWESPHLDFLLPSSHDWFSWHCLTREAAPGAAFHRAFEGHHRSPPCCLLVRIYKNMPLTGLSITHRFLLFTYQLSRLVKISDNVLSISVSISKAEEWWQWLVMRLGCLF